MEKIISLIKKVLLMTLIILSIISCLDENKQMDSKIETKVYKTTELFRIGYELRNCKSIFSHISQRLNDSIFKSPNLYWYQTIILLDEENEKVDWTLVNESYPLPSGVHDVLSFNICIKNENVFINHNKSSICQIKDQAEKYIYNTEFAHDKTTKIRKKIDFFGEVETSKINAVIRSNIEAKNELSNDEWKLFFDCFHELVQLIELKKNKISLDKWGIRYNDLSFEKQIAITKYVNFNITIIFNSDC